MEKALKQSAAQVDMDKIVSLCKRRGIIFQSSEIYGGLGSVWDYGPLGVELKRNVKEAWWRAIVHHRNDVVGLDSAILMHSKVWQASGHLESFTDPMVECQHCKHRFRPDDIMVGAAKTENGAAVRLSILGGTEEAVRTALEDRAKKIDSPLNNTTIHVLRMLDVAHSSEVTGHVPCPICEERGLVNPGMLDPSAPPRQFNLMFKTFMGPVEDGASVVYLRPETAQGIFVQFENILNSTRKRLPFGVAQVGKAFRNEITPGNFTFRTREFEQMEMEFFVKPAEDQKWLDYWVQQRFDWYVDLGIRKENLRLRWHDSKELAHYAKATADVEYLFPMGWSELEGIANRTDFDLRQHAQHSGKPLTYFDNETQEHVIPYVIEPSGGVDRATLAFIVDAYSEEEAPTAGGKMEKRVLLKLHKDLAPVNVAVLPLSRHDYLVPLAKEVFNEVRKHFRAQYDDAQSIGRRYRRQDEIGTPLCVTIDFNSLQDHAVTIRDRDTMQQVRVNIDRLSDALRDKLNG